MSRQSDASKGLRSRSPLDGNDLIVAPGVYDALSAKLVERAGFAVAYLTSYGVTATALARPDVGLITLSEMVAKTASVCDATKLHLIADGEAGFGNAVNTARMVRELERSGASGVDMQDQRFPRIHGLAPGEKELIPANEHVKKLEAAASTRTDPDFVIIGRTEAGDVGEATRRLSAYVNAGADMVFPHAPFSVPELETIAASVKAPMILNYPLLKRDGSRGPGVSDLAHPCFKIVLFPVSALFASTMASIRMLERIKREGTDGDGDMVSFAEFDEIIGAAELREFEGKYLPRRDEGS